MFILNAKNFDDLIKKVRVRTGLTQAQLAAASGVGIRFVRELEKGKESCQLEKSLLVMQMLGIRLNFF